MCSPHRSLPTPNNGRVDDDFHTVHPARGTRASRYTAPYVFFFPLQKASLLHKTNGAWSRFATGKSRTSLFLNAFKERPLFKKIERNATFPPSPAVKKSRCWCPPSLFFLFFNSQGCGTGKIRLLASATGIEVSGVRKIMQYPAAKTWFPAGEAWPATAPCATTSLGKKPRGVQHGCKCLQTFCFFFFVWRRSLCNSPFLKSRHLAVKNRRASPCPSRQNATIHRIGFSRLPAVATFCPQRPIADRPHWKSPCSALSMEKTRTSARKCGESSGVFPLSSPVQPLPSTLCRGCSSHHRTNRGP